MCCPQNRHAEKGQEWTDSTFGLGRGMAGHRCPGPDPDFRAGRTRRSAYGAGEPLRIEQGDISYYY